MPRRSIKKRHSNEENESPGSSKPKRWKEDDLSLVSGRVKCIELENFMCHEKLKIEFDLDNNNCFYIGGPNGSGKSALFAALNIGLGGRGNHNDRGNSVISYIKDGRRTAKIRITLTNRGQGSHPDFGEYSIIERTINQNSSTYSLKSVKGGRETKVSSKKSELDKLMNRYGIQLCNPIFWMSQDRSRHFLQQMKPDKLYEIFIYATELDRTRECYGKVDEIVKDIKRVVSHFEGFFVLKKAEIKKAQAQRGQRMNIDSFKRELTTLGWYLLWFPLRDAIADLDALERKQKETDKALNEIRDRIIQNRKDRAAKNDEMTPLNDKLAQFSDYSEKVLCALKEKEKKRSQIKIEIKGLHENIDSKKRKEREMRTTIAAIDKEIKAKQAAMLSAEGNDERALIQKKIDKIDEEMINIEDNMKTTKEERIQANNDYKNADSETNELEEDKYEVEQKMKNAEKEIRMSKAVAANAIARFGDEIPRIIEAIKSNLNKFDFEPLGPLGQYVTVKDDKWTYAIEEALGRNLASFALHSQKDRRILEDLCKKMRVPAPNVVVTNFNVPPHDTRNNAPSGNIDTVERQIHVSNHTVRNVLIDVANIEAIMLIDNDDQARDILNGKCPINIRRAYTSTGGSGYGSNGQGGQYRFYPGLNENNNARFLIQNKTYDVNALKAVVDREKNHLREIMLRLNEVKSKVVKFEKERNRLDRVIGELERKKSSLTIQKRSLKRDLEAVEDKEDDDTLLENLRLGKEDQLKSIEESTNEREEINKILKVAEGKLKIVTDEVNEAKEAVDNANVGCEPLEKELDEIKKELDRMDATHEKYVANQKKIIEEKEKFHDEFVRLERAKDEATETSELAHSDKMKAAFASTGGKPAEYDDPPDMDTMPSTDDAQKMYEDIERKIIAAEDAMGANVVTEEEYKKMIEEYNINSKYLRRLKKIQKILEQAQTNREIKLPLVRHAITMRLKMSFQNLMSMRSFGGELRVRNRAKVIDISVHTHPRIDEDEDAREERRKANIIQDLKGLSGGERSYTTACFIMSLWEIMEAPFRCMDEFDVFMDMVNRKIIMDLLVKLATEQFSHNQFVFFTPQGIRELGERNGVQIFEMPRVRD